MLEIICISLHFLVWIGIGLIITGGIGLSYGLYYTPDSNVTENTTKTKESYKEDRFVDDFFNKGSWQEIFIKYYTWNDEFKINEVISFDAQVRVTEPVDPFYVHIYHQHEERYFGDNPPLDVLEYKSGVLPRFGKPGRIFNVQLFFESSNCDPAIHFNEGVNTENCSYNYRGGGNTTFSEYGKYFVQVSAMKMNGEPKNYTSTKPILDLQSERFENLETSTQEIGTKIDTLKKTFGISNQQSTFTTLGMGGLGVGIASVAIGISRGEAIKQRKYRILDAKKYDLKEELNNLRDELRDLPSDDVNQDIASTRSDLESKIRKIESELEEIKKTVNPANEGFQIHEKKIKEKDQIIEELSSEINTLKDRLDKVEKKVK